MNDDELEAMKARLVEMTQTFFTANGHMQLTDALQGRFKAQVEQVFMEALADQAISEDFADQFEVRTFIDYSNNSLEARLTPKTLMAHDMVMEMWMPHACVIDVLGNEKPLPSFVDNLPPDERKLSLGYCQRTVEGDIQILPVRYRPGWVLIVDEEAKLKKKMVNPVATFLYGAPNDFVAGTVIYCPREMIK